MEEQSSLTVKGVMKEGGHRSRRSSGPRADLRIGSAEAEMRSCESCDHPTRTSSHPPDETAKDLQTELVIHTGAPTTHAQLTYQQISLGRTQWSPLINPGPRK